MYPKIKDQRINRNQIMFTSTSQYNISTRINSARSLKNDDYQLYNNFIATPISSIQFK